MSVVIKKKQGTPKKVLPHSSEPLKVYSLKLPSSVQQFLDDLSQDASDTLGWTVSSSTLLRVMLTYIQQQPSSWVAKQLHPLIEEEIAQGRVWGTKGKKGKTADRKEIGGEITKYDRLLIRVGKQKGKRT